MKNGKQWTGLNYQGKPTRVVYNDKGFAVDLEFVNEEDRIPIVNYAKSLNDDNIKIIESTDNFDEELDDFLQDVSPSSHTKEVTLPKKKKLKKKRVFVNPYNKFTDKFFGEK